MHLLLRMLAYYLEWHLRRQLAPLLFSEEGEPQRRAGRWGRCSARRRPSARIARARRTADGSLPVQSLADVLAGLGTLSAVELKYEQVPGYAVPTPSELEPLHERVFELLGFQPHPAPALSAPPDSAGKALPRTPSYAPTACSKCGHSAPWRAQRGLDLTKSPKWLTHRTFHQFKLAIYDGVQ